MTATPEIQSAFKRWAMAELACHYAAPCPDEVMDGLTGAVSDAFDALQGMPPTSGDDMLLKLYPLLLREFEPGAGDPPLRLRACYEYDEAFMQRLRDDLSGRSDALREVMDEPHPSARRAA